MSLKVVCTITISNQQYEAGTSDEDIIEVVGFQSSTGSFASFGAQAIDSMVDSAIYGAQKSARDKLRAIKGDYEILN